MRVILSGQACVALLIDGNTVNSIHYERMSQLVPRQLEELSLLFSGTTDLEYFDDVNSVDQVRDKLADAVDTTEALNLVMYLCDDALSPDTMQSAARELEELIVYPEIVEVLENVLFAANLPESAASLESALTACAVSSSPYSMAFFARLLDHQPAIQKICYTWSLIPAEEFNQSTREYAQAVCVQHGLFRELVQEFHQTRSVVYAASQSASNPGLLEVLPNVAGVLNSWSQALLESTALENLPAEQSSSIQNFRIRVTEAILFNAKNEATIAEWVMRYPYLEWHLGSKALPKLQYRRVAPITGETQIHDSTVLGILGSGSFGIVFLARHRSLGDLAIKIPRQRITSWNDQTIVDHAREYEQEREIDRFVRTHLQNGDTDEKTRAAFSHLRKSRLQLLDELILSDFNQGCSRRFMRECNMVQRISHPHVVQVHHVGEIGYQQPRDLFGNREWKTSAPCLVMQYLLAAKLQTVIQRQESRHLERDLARILRVGRDIALGTAAIHDNGSPHRDLSWNNVVILDQTETAIVVDLGNVMGSNQVRDDGAGGSMYVRVGTTGFIAPEQIERSLAEFASDQFSLGVMLYLWCTAQFPYRPEQRADKLDIYIADGPEGKPRDLADCLRFPIQKMSAQSQAAFRELSNQVMLSLSRDPQKRHESMRDYAACLESVLIDLGLSKIRPLKKSELIISGVIKEAATEIGFGTTPRENCIAGTLMLQALARHSRFEIDRSIRNLVGAIDESLSDETPTPNERQKEIASRAYDCVSSLSTILRSIALQVVPPKGERPQHAFGQMLRQLIEETVATTSQLLTPALAIKGNRARNHIDRLKSESSSVPPVDSAVEFEKFLGLVRKVTADLGLRDFSIAVYVRQCLKRAHFYEEDE